jgi:hypothetical protein
MLPNRSQAMSAAFRPMAPRCRRNAELEHATVTGSEPVQSQIARDYIAQGRSDWRGLAVVSSLFATKLEQMVPVTMAKN